MLQWQAQRFEFIISTIPIWWPSWNPTWRITTEHWQNGEKFLSFWGKFPLLRFLSWATRCPKGITWTLWKRVQRSLSQKQYRKNQAYLCIYLFLSKTLGTKYERTVSRRKLQFGSFWRLLRPTDDLYFRFCEKSEAKRAQFVKNMYLDLCTNQRT